MIPTNKQLKKKIKKNKIHIEKKPYFSLVREYLELEEKFSKDYIELIPLFLEMIAYPLYVLYQLIKGDYSPFHLLTILKTYELWSNYFRYCELQTELKTWIPTVKKIGGPWISTNDSKYHWFVYADAMERMVSQKID